MLVLTLLSHGCPTQAIVAAFGLDERTVARWFSEAGRHCQRVHEHLVEQGQVDLQHVQADELWVKQVGGKVWMALALAVPSRLWLGGVISRQRDLPLITRLVQRVRACAVTPTILVWSALNMGAGHGQVFRKVVLPGARPLVFAGVRVSLALSFILLFSTEMINARSGLGSLIRQAESSLAFDLMYVSIVAIAILGWASDRLLRAIRARVLAWHEAKTA